MISRRSFLGGSVATVAAMGAARGDVDQPGRALVAISLDLEMSRHYPTRDQTHWDYEKGNLDEATKRYAVAAARRVKDAGDRIHFFCVGRVLEQEDVGWLEGLIRDGHPVGNHSYDHVNVLATRPEDVQFRFRRAPWLIEGKSPKQVIAENIRLSARAMSLRLGIEPAGFRTPGGFAEGLTGRPDVQRILLDQGYSWVSSKYPAHPLGEQGRAPSEQVLDAIVAAQRQAQPTVYPSGLVEVPMSPISDVSALRSGRWPLEAFLEATRRALGWAIEHGAAFDFLAHPSCLVVEDPEFRAIDLICRMVHEAGERAAIVDLATIARRARSHSES